MTKPIDLVRAMLEKEKLCQWSSPTKRTTEGYAVAACDCPENYQVPALLIVDGNKHCSQEDWNGCPFNKA